MVLGVQIDDMDRLAVSTEISYTGMTIEFGLLLTQGTFLHVRSGVYSYWIHTEKSCLSIPNKMVIKAY